MSVPMSDACLLPVLRIASDGLEHSRLEYEGLVADYFNLTREERAETVKSKSGARRIYNSVNYALKVFQESSVLSLVKRSTFLITDRGWWLFNEYPNELSQKILRQFLKVHHLPKRVETLLLSPANDDPDSWQDFRRRVRRAQGAFRELLLKAYDGKCCISGYEVEEALEAVHILRHCETGNNDIANGLLLRSDLHALFDAGLISIAPETLAVQLSRKLIGTRYWTELEGRILRPRECGPELEPKYLREKLLRDKRCGNKRGRE